MFLRDSAPASPSRSTHPAAAHAWPAHSRDTDAGPAKPSAISVGFVILEQDGIDDGVGALGRLDCCLKTFFAAHVHAVREDDDRLAAGLLLHHFVGCQEDCVIEKRSAAMTAGTASLSRSRGRCFLLLRYWYG